MQITKNREETCKLAASLAAKIKQGGIICLFGDLGSGKTTFTKGLAHALGIDSFSIKSPTYTYIRKHNNIYHIDLYRLEQVDELLWREIDEILENPKNIVIIEWADRLQEKLPTKRIEVHMKYLDENSRGIRIDYL